MELFTICLLNDTANMRPFNLHLDKGLIQTLDKFQVLQTWIFFGWTKNNIDTTLLG